MIKLPIPNDLQQTISRWLLQGKAKAKLLSSLTSSLTHAHKYVGSDLGRSLVTCSQLKEGVNSGQMLLGGLVCIVPFKERVP